MADGTPDRPSGGGKTLDALSKEDLIKFSKKQAVTVSQMKAKLVDLQKTKEQLSTENAELQSELNGFKDQASSLREENDCLNQKLETVTASYVALVDEVSGRIFVDIT